jgi:hypothetical protein
MMAEKNDFMNYVEKRLHHWARWYSQGNFNGLGFPSENIAYVLMTVGALIKSTGAKPLPCDEEAEEIETLVTEMAKHNINMASALRVNYFTRKKARARSDVIDASPAQFKIYIQMAKQWLAGRLSATYSPRLRTPKY